MDDQITLTLTKSELETVMYALEIAEADCIESASDATSLAEDRTNWSEAAEEMRQLRPKLQSLAA